jgi:hypothetical protein
MAGWRVVVLQVLGPKKTGLAGMRNRLSYNSKGSPCVGQSPVTEIAGKKELPPAFFIFISLGQSSTIFEFCFFDQKVCLNLLNHFLSPESTILVHNYTTGLP